MIGINDEIAMEARRYGESIGQEALEEAAGFTRAELEKQYAEAVAMAAYYTKLESRISAVPRMCFDSIRQALLSIRADELLDQAERAEAEGWPLSKHVTVRTAPLLTLLSRCMLMVGNTTEAEKGSRHRKE